ncbi:hypothetical protein EON65_56530, partial [archaeon]
MGATLAFILYLCFLCVFLVYSEVEVDIAWEFDTNNNKYRSGWANATAEAIDLTAQEEFGELRCRIQGYNPKLDSPTLYLPITHRHYLVMRARYDGTATQARLLLRSGAQPSPREQSSVNTAYWSARQAMKVVTSSAATSPSYDASQVVDGN